MAKVVVSKLSGKSAGRERPVVAEKRVRKLDGTVTMVRTLEISGAKFGAGLQYVFRKNVAKARRDNKRATGATDVIVTAKR